VFANPYNTIITTSNGPSWTTLGNYNIGTDPQHLRGSLTSSNGTGTYTTNGLASGLASGVVGSAASFSNNIKNCVSTYTSSIDLGPTLDMLSDNQVKSSPLRSRSMSKSLKKESVETGRVEMGSHSDQEFKYVNKTFEYSAFHTVEYKMLPVSQKVNTIEDLNVKRYCTQCGAKSGKTDNFCANCGKKI
jgi:hypothetical protein